MISRTGSLPARFTTADRCTFHHVVRWRAPGSQQSRRLRRRTLRARGLIASFPVDVDRSPAPLAALVPSYRPIFDRLLAVCEGDERIRALWLSGSLAKGTADGGSDLDCLLAIRDPDFDEFAARWREWLAAITPTLLARELPFARGAFYSTTAGCERLDVVCEPVSKLPASQFRYRSVVFDRDGLDAAVPAPDPRPRPDLDRLRWMVEEFFRLEAIAPFMLNV